MYPHFIIAFQKSKRVQGIYQNFQFPCRRLQIVFKKVKESQK